MKNAGSGWIQLQTSTSDPIWMKRSLLDQLELRSGSKAVHPKQTKAEVF